MDYKNDERYWDIKLLNKWFFIAASLWTLSMIWMFVDDNDDEFKTYQIEYYNLLKLKTESKYNDLYSEVSNLKKELESDLEEKKKVLESRQDEIQLITDSLQIQKNKYAKIDIDFKATEEQINNLKRYKQNRDNTNVKTNLDDLKKTAKSNDNIIPSLIHCIENQCTLGEMSDTLRDVFGEY